MLSWALGGMARHPSHRLSLQDRVFRAIVSRRRGMALSLVANVVLLALLVFKSAPQPAFRRCGNFQEKLLWLLHTSGQKKGRGRHL
jgi:hypothetical protein